jgi:hypothetical protein
MVRTRPVRPGAGGRADAATRRLQPDAMTFLDLNQGDHAAALKPQPGERAYLPGFWEMHHQEAMILAGMFAAIAAIIFTLWLLWYFRGTIQKLAAEFRRPAWPRSPRPPEA